MCLYISAKYNKIDCISNTFQDLTLNQMCMNQFINTYGLFFFFKFMFWIINFRSIIRGSCLEHFLWNFPLVNATRQHWWQVNIGSGNEWLGAVRQQAITLDNVDPDLCYHAASLGINVLTHWGWDKMSANKIWWLCLVPTSTTRCANDVG